MIYSYPPAEPSHIIGFEGFERWIATTNPRRLFRWPDLETFEVIVRNALRWTLLILLFFRRTHFLKALFLNCCLCIGTCAEQHVPLVASGIHFEIFVILGWLLFHITDSEAQEWFYSIDRIAACTCLVLESFYMALYRRYEGSKSKLSNQQKANHRWTYEVINVEGSCTA